MSGINGLNRLERLASAHDRLAEIVLISPLCARNLNGCAERHSG